MNIIRTLIAVHSEIGDQFKGLVAFLVSARRERPSQSPHHRALWILIEHGGQMERGRLRAAAGMRYALLDPILEELAREGKIRISDGTITSAWLIDAAFLDNMTT